MNEETIIIVDDGDFFYGTPAQWRDCFFSNASKENIEAYCKQYGMKVTFTDPDSL